MHCSPKSADETSWTLPIEHPSVHANSVLSLPSDCKFVQFKYSSFAISTYKHAIRKGYLSTIPRLTSALFGKHTPNSVASAMGHLDRRRQGLDSILRKSSLCQRLHPRSSSSKLAHTKTTSTICPRSLQQPARLIPIMSTPNSAPLLTPMPPVAYPDAMHIIWSVATTVIYTSKLCNQEHLPRISTPTTTRPSFIGLRTATFHPLSASMPRPQSRSNNSYSTKSTLPPSNISQPVLTVPIALNIAFGRTISSPHWPPLRPSFLCPIGTS